MHGPCCNTFTLYTSGTNRTMPPSLSSLTVSSRMRGRLVVSVSQTVFSRAVSAVGTERGGMDKHHGRSLQKEARAALATERRFPATSSSTGCALIRDHDCVHCSSVRLRQTTVSSLVIPHRQLYYNLKALPYETHYSLFVNVRLCTYMSCHVIKVREGYALLKVTRDTNF